MKRKYSCLLISLFLLLSLLLSMPVLAAGIKKGAEEKISIKDAIQFRAFASYQQSPLIKKENYSGVDYLKNKDFAPVKDRLPETPKVITEAAMPDGLGVYGGIWRDFSAWPPKSYNWFSGLTTGAYGLDDMYLEPVLSDYMATFLKEGMTPEPNLARSWDWSNNKKTLTLHLLKGVKWSDGVEFTADDILFTYQLYRDSKVPVAGSRWKINGKYPEMKKIDKYTVEIDLPEASNQIYYNLMKMFPMPEHIYQQYYPVYSQNKDVDYNTFKNAFRVPSVPVVLGPYIPYKFKTGEIAELIRNPYYFKVDAAGKQLPYIDKVRYIFGQETQQSTMQLMAGNIDWANMDDPSQFPSWMSNRERGNYRIIIPEPHQLYTVRFNYMLWKESMQDPVRDTEVRKIFRNLKFRQAFSEALNRQEIMNLFAPAPVLASAPVAGVALSSAFYNTAAQTRYTYNKEAAEKLLDEVGLKDVDNDGIREFPADSALAGQDFTVSILVASDLNDLKNISELIAKNLKEVGLNVELRVQNQALIGNRTDAGTFDLLIGRGLEAAVPLSNLGAFGPLDNYNPSWHKADPDGKRKLLPFENDLQALLYKLQTAMTFSEQAKLMDQLQHIYSSNVYTVGVLARSKAHAIANRFKNVHPTAAKLIWDDRQYTLPWTVWVPEDQQLK